MLPTFFSWPRFHDFNQGHSQIWGSADLGCEALAGWICFEPQGWPSHTCSTFCSETRAEGQQLPGLPVLWRRQRHKGQVQTHKHTSKPYSIMHLSLLPTNANNMAQLLPEKFISKLVLPSSHFSQELYLKKKKIVSSNDYALQSCIHAFM